MRDIAVRIHALSVLSRDSLVLSLESSALTSTSGLLSLIGSPCYEILFFVLNTAHSLCFAYNCLSLWILRLAAGDKTNSCGHPPSHEQPELIVKPLLL